MEWRAYDRAGGPEYSRVHQIVVAMSVTECSVGPVSMEISTRMHHMHRTHRSGDAEKEIVCLCAEYRYHGTTIEDDVIIAEAAECQLDTEFGVKTHRHSRDGITHFPQYPQYLLL